MFSMIHLTIILRMILYNQKNNSFLFYNAKEIDNMLICKFKSSGLMVDLAVLSVNIFS